MNTGDAQAAPRSVLIIEDDPEGRRTLERVFRRAGFETTAVQDGLEAFNAVQSRRYDVLLCDLRMPRLGGIALFEQLEETFPTMASRTVFVTAYAQAAGIAEFLAKTGQPVFNKPYDVAELLEAARTIAERRDSTSYEIPTNG